MTRDLYSLNLLADLLAKLLVLHRQILFSLAIAEVVLLIGCGIVEIPLNIFIGRINGRLARPSVRRK